MTPAASVDGSYSRHDSLSNGLICPYATCDIRIFDEYSSNKCETILIHSLWSSILEHPILSILLSRSKNSRIIGSVFLYSFSFCSRENAKKFIRNDKKIVRASFSIFEKCSLFRRVCLFAATRRSILPWEKEKKTCRGCKRVCRASRRCIILYGPVGADFNIKLSLVSRTGTWRTPAEIRRWIRARTTGSYWVTRTRRTQCSASVDNTTHATHGTWRSR